jgi:hypothetical protein
MSADALTRLASWFAANCDGEREQHHGISIVSTDNPGWWMTVDLHGMPLAAKAFAPLSEGIGPRGHPVAERWLDCRIKDNEWHGAGDATRLNEIVGIFLDWAEGAGS